MSQQKQSATPASFPSPEERARIIERRATLMYELYSRLALRESHSAGADTRRQQLIHEYGLAEVQRMIDRIGRNFQARRAVGDHEDEWLYRDYIKRYWRWGGQRPLLQMDEERRLNYERTILLLRQMVHRKNPGAPGSPQLAPLSPADERRLAELDDLLLASPDLWDDLVPEDPPAVLPPLPSLPPTISSPPPQRSLEDQLDDLVDEGNRLFQKQQTAAACDRWLAAWGLVKQLVRPEHRTAFQFSQAHGHGNFVDNWAGELICELGNAAIDDPAYNEHQLQFSREYLAQFPDTEPGMVVNMLRAQGEALWRMGRRPGAEQTYASLIEWLPDDA